MSGGGVRKAGRSHSPELAPDPTAAPVTDGAVFPDNKCALGILALLISLSLSLFSDTTHSRALWYSKTTTSMAY